MIYAAVGLLGVATVLTIWSMVVYLKAGLSHMTEDSATSTPAVVATEDLQKSAPVDASKTPEAEDLKSNAQD